MTATLDGLMQDFPLTLQHVRRRMRDSHPGSELVTLTDAGTVRASYGEISERVDRLARVLERLGVQRGDRVGTFAWNNQSHFELYMAVPCVGAVLHTLNIRLFAEQLTYIVEHAQDRVVFLDASLIPILETLAGQMPAVRNFVVMGDPETVRAELPRLPNALLYEELMEEAGPGAFAYPEIDEREAAALCYTSGTTGNPKGVLYSHRSIALHSTASLMADALGLCSRDRALVVVPMFHANAWGIPHAAALCGADLIMPDRFLQAEPLARLIESERASIMGCVPTIFADLLRYADSHEVDLSSLQNAACGGSAVPKQLMRDFQQRHGVRIFQAWGMTETSPVATYSRPAEPRAQGRAQPQCQRPGSPADAAAAAAGIADAPDPQEQQRYWQQRARQGAPLPWVEMRLVGDDGQPVAWDGEATGEIEVRGPWIAAAYYNDPTGDEKFDSGWLRTGDIAHGDPDGAVQITDRSKDVIKSGGEWISSVELENEVMSHPDVVEAAVIAKPDDKWAERPLCCVVAREGSGVTAEQLVEHLRGKVAKWWLPDEFAFVPEVPKTSVGKFDKKALRAQLADGCLPGRVTVGAGAGSAAK